MVRKLLGGPSVVAILPEATCFTKNGLDGRVSPECGLVEGGCYWFFLSFFSGFLFNTLSFRVLCPLKVFLMSI